MNYIYLRTLLVFHFTLLTIFAQNQNDSTVANNTFGIVGAPFLSYAPETRWSFGVAGLFYFYLEKPSIKEARPSSVYSNIQYTTRKQFTIKAEYDFYFLEDNYRMYGDIYFSKFPYLFFGIGNNTKTVDEENYTPRFFKTEINIIRKLLSLNEGKLSAGIRFDYRKDKIIEKDLNGQLSAGNIPGSNGGVISGMGFSLNFDSRDNSFSTANGEYLDLKSTFYESFLGSDFSYQRYSLDLRKFFSLNVLDTTHVLAFQTFTDLTECTVPFYLLPSFGGEMNLRGIFIGRYRDMNSFFIQSEYRLPVYWRFGLAFFGGVGEVFKNVDAFRISELKLAGGFGIRFTVIPEESVSVRIDFGFSKDDSEFYISFNEAF